LSCSLFCRSDLPATRGRVRRALSPRYAIPVFQIERKTNDEIDRVERSDKKSLPLNTLQETYVFIFRDDSNSQSVIGGA
jgi:hypothetical protein